MSREVHVRLCVQQRLTRSAGNLILPGEKLEPCNLGSSVAGNQNTEALLTPHEKSVEQVKPYNWDDQEVGGR